MYLLIGSITALFLGFSAAYLYTRLQEGSDPIRLPILFYVNTLVLLASSWCLHQAKNAYLNDKTEQYQGLLVITLILSTTFLISQVFAWNSLLQNDVLINHNNMASYLYIISGLHFLHVIVGIPFLVAFIFVAYKKMKEPISVLVYFSDPGKLRKLRILTIYWHFLDILWIYLVFFFGVNLLL
jgi:cytochrome c oxidase subunit 3